VQIEEDEIIPEVQDSAEEIKLRQSLLTLQDLFEAAQNKEFSAQKVYAFVGRDGKS